MVSLEKNKNHHQNVQTLPLDKCMCTLNTSLPENTLADYSLQLCRQVCHMKVIRPGRKMINNIYLDYKMSTTEMEPIQASKQHQNDHFDFLLLYKWVISLQQSDHHHTKSNLYVSKEPQKFLNLPKKLTIEYLQAGTGLLLAGVGKLVNDVKKANTFKRVSFCN